MYPCDEWYIEVHLTEYHPVFGANFFIKTLDSDGGQTTLTSFGFSGSTMEFAPVESGGFPKPGTNKTATLIRSIEFWSMAYPSQTYPIDYTIIVHFVPRPGYNRGGPTPAEALLLQPSPSTVNMSIATWENQYYRVPLAANGSLSVSGSMTNENWGYSTNIYIDVYNLNDQKLQTLAVVSIPKNTDANGQHDPNGVTVNFQSTTPFINPNGQATDFYVRFRNTGNATLHASTVTIQFDAGFSCTFPPIIRKGFEPESTVTYKFVTTWGNDNSSGVVAAFARWVQSNFGVGLNVSFVHDPVGSSPNLTMVRGPLTYPVVAGTITESLVFDLDGFLIQGGVIFTTDTTWLESASGYFKIGLHEIGHLSGLHHPTGPNGSSIMLDGIIGKDDSGGRLPTSITGCDASQAWNAQFYE
jgi:hypothetical protein